MSRSTIRQPHPVNPKTGRAPHPRFIDIEGQSFGRLRVLHYCGSQRAGKRNRPFWACLCECGAEVVVESRNIRSGHTVSCGCYHRDVAGANLETHGMTGHPLHRTWKGMIERCCNPSARSYRDYGARGVTVCDRWRNDFAAFVADMGRKPSGSHSIDRVDNSQGYEPSNCRWATPTEQANNRRKRRRTAAPKEIRA